MLTDRVGEIAQLRELLRLAVDVTGVLLPSISFFVQEDTLAVPLGFKDLLIIVK